MQEDQQFIERVEAIIENFIRRQGQNNELQVIIQQKEKLIKSINQHIEMIITSILSSKFDQVLYLWIKLLNNPNMKNGEYPQTQEIFKNDHDKLNQMLNKHEKQINLIMDTQQLQYLFMSTNQINLDIKLQVSDIVADKMSQIDDQFADIQRQMRGLKYKLIQRSIFITNRYQKAQHKGQIFQKTKQN
ncbi:hypothetical protein pb186bvf_016900 [Paramecium bursaria]